MKYFPHHPLNSVVLKSRIKQRRNIYFNSIRLSHEIATNRNKLRSGLLPSSLSSL
jgi:hypothetical protein